MIRDEGGMTLVELLIAMMVLALILGPLLGSIIVGLNTTDDTIQRVAESVDAQNASSLFIADVQSAVTASVTPTISEGACSLTNVLISFRWTDPGDIAIPTPPATDDDLERLVAYVTETVVGQERAKAAGGATLGQLTNLIRRDCNRPPGGTYGAPESLNVASFLNPSTGPVVRCDSGALGACPAQPTYVEIVATEAAGFEYRLSAKRRSTG